MGPTRKTIAMAGVGCLAAVIAGCSANGVLTRLTVTPSPHEQYADGLRSASLDQTALGRDWLRVGEAVLASAVTVPLPFRETGYFPAEAAAVAYQFELPRGRRLSVEVSFDSLDGGQLFVDLFEHREGEAPRRVESLTEGATLTYEVPRDGRYLLRLQPELMRSGRFTIVERTLASLRFPVSGLTAAAVQSEFGAARDAGRREHEGIDIFAARGTPVVAVVDGHAGTGTNGLGGNVVWLRDGRTGRRFYYAHLDKWALDGASPVRAGDVLGYVGNTGNAQTTSPHLHFGIYERGAIDPLPFLRMDDAVPPAVKGSLDRLGEWIRVSAARTPLREGVARTSAARAQLERTVVMRAMGITAEGLRVVIPDGSTGYVAAGTTVAARTTLRRQRLAAGATLYERPLAQAPVIEVVEAPVDVGVLGTFDGYLLVRRDDPPTEAWVQAAPSARTSARTSAAQPVDGRQQVRALVPAQALP